MQVAFKDKAKYFTVRDLGENLEPILFAKKFAGFFISQRQKAKHRDIMPRHRSSLTSAIRLRLIAWSKRFSSLPRQKRLKILSGNSQTRADLVHNFPPHKWIANPRNGFGEASRQLHLGP